MNYLLKAVFYITLASSILACKEDDIEFAKRDTDEINFEYAQSSKTFTLRTNGAWKVEDTREWVTISPKQGFGKGNELQTITVQVADNIGESRKDTIYIIAAEKRIAITINQEDGFFTWKTPIFSGTFLQGEAISEGQLLIPYDKAIGKEKVSVKVTLKGDGAAGIKTVTQEEIELRKGSGNVIIPITGVPRSMGDLSGEIEILSDNSSLIAKLSSDKGFVASDNIIYSMNFDKCIWGGDYIKNIAGVRPPIASTTLPGAEATGTCKSTDDGTVDFFNASTNKMLTADRGLSEWDGSKVYEKPGYVKIGTGSSLGYIITPKLNFTELGLESATTLFYQFNWARWIGENSDIVVSVLNAGKMDNIILSGETPAREWQLLTLKIENATSETQIKISGTKAGNNRFFFDNLKIYAAVEVPIIIEKQLKAPTGLKVTPKGANNIALEWDKNNDATSYLIQAINIDDTSDIHSATTNQTDFTLDNLKGGTTYKCQVKALYSLNSNFDSEFSEEVIVTTADSKRLEKPTLSIISSTDKIIVVDFGIYNQISDVNKGRTYTLEIAESEKGEPIRQYPNFNILNYSYTSFFHERNRFAFSELEANKTYYIRITHNAIPETEYNDSETAIISAKTQPTPILDENVILYKDFEDFSWGGRFSDMAWGCIPTSADQKSVPILRVKDILNYGYPVKNVDDSFNTLSEINAPEYHTSRWGNEGWEGYKIYEICGQIKFGTSSNYGYLTTPKLTKLGANKANIELTFSTMSYHEPGRSEDGLDLYVDILGNGTISSATSGMIANDKKSTSLFNNTNVNADNSLKQKEYQWTKHKLLIENADETTQIKIKTGTAQDGKASKKRMILDDLKVTRK